MSAWSEGYTSDVTYTYGYYNELNPINLTIPFLMAGLAPPKIENACELGFGQGISLNMHSATSNIKWYGTDFNPSHAFFAQSLANQIGSNKPVISDQGFNEFCMRDDLPEFDFICLHGIWSWISDENRHIIVDFIRRKLKFGGILYISYNTLPGWMTLSPVRHLLVEHKRLMSSSEHDSVVTARAALDYSKNILEMSPILCQVNPTLMPSVTQLLEQNSNYLVHEYLNQDWHPMFFAQLEKWLEPAKLSYACSAKYLDDFSGCLFTTEQVEFINQIQNKSFAQTVKDYMLNKQFRCDYWVKGSLALSQTEMIEQWKKLRIILVVARSDIVKTISNTLTTNLLDEIFDPILDILSDYQIHSVADLLESLENKVEINAIFTALAILFGKKDIRLVQDDDIIAQVKPRCNALNRYLLDKAKNFGGTGEIVASPVTGEGFLLTELEALCILANQSKLAQDKWTDFIWDIFKAKNRLMIKDGETLTEEKENLAEIEKKKNLFIEKRLKIFQSLGIID